jgi:hypothetical protein
MGLPFVVTSAFAGLSGVWLLSKSFPQTVVPVLQAACAFVIILVLAVDCILFLCSLQWVFVLSLALLTNLEEFGVALLLAGLIAALHFSAKYSVRFIVDGTMGNRESGLVASAGCLVGAALIHFAADGDASESISFDAFEFCRGLAIGSDHCYFALLIIYGSNIALCGIQLAL